MYDEFPNCRTAGCPNESSRDDGLCFTCAAQGYKHNHLARVFADDPPTRIDILDDEAWGRMVGREEMEVSNV